MWKLSFPQTLLIYNRKGYFPFNNFSKFAIENYYMMLYFENINANLVRCISYDLKMFIRKLFLIVSFSKEKIFKCKIFETCSKLNKIVKRWVCSSDTLILFFSYNFVILGVFILLYGKCSLPQNRFSFPLTSSN